MTTAEPTGLVDWLAARANARAARHSVRRRLPLGRDHALCVTAEGDRLVNFSSNDYLGLAGHPAVAAALAQGAQAHGAGSGASALVSGYHPAHQRLENALAEFLQRDAVVLFSSGYLANLAVATSLAGRHDLLVQDKLCHASLIDAARLSGARLQRFPHGDLAAVERQLSATCRGHKLLVSDGVFSMDGDSAALPELVDAARRYRAWLVIDDAHGIGVTGPGGAGSVAASGLGQHEVPVLVGTLGKAFGCAGAFVAGSTALAEHLVNEARSAIYTTAMPAALADAAHAALQVMRQEHGRREQLHERIAQFRDGARQRGLPLLDSASPIQPLVLGDARRALHWSQQLRRQGQLVIAIRPPTVPAGTSRLRVTLSAAHSPAQVEQLLVALDQCQQRS